MVTVPHRLLDSPEVSVLHHCANLTVLRKRVRAALHERPSYVSQHALSFVTEGQQVIYDEHGGCIRVRPGQAGLMRRGLYSVTDLLAGDTDAFATTVVFFSDAILAKALGESPVPAVGATADLQLLRKVESGWANGLVVAESPNAAAADAPLAAARGLLANLAAADGGQATALAGLRHVRRRPLREFMRAHFDKPLQLADYAYLTGRSERSFRRDFRARFGESPKRWLVARRLERARELMRQESLSVAGVAAAVGYRNTSHFIKRYRERYGVTPGVRHDAAHHATGPCAAPPA